MIVCHTCFRIVCVADTGIHMCTALTTRCVRVWGGHPLTLGVWVKRLQRGGGAHSLELQAARCANLWRSSTLLGYHNMVAWLQGFPSMAMSHFHMEGREMGGRGGWQLTAVDYMLCVRYLHWYVCSQLSHAHKDTSTTRSYTLCFWDVGSVWCC